ncbi:MAG: delta-60 repeat domain-containing protein [Isosphaerales bacterium]
MKKPTFVPTPDLLETRIVLSGGPKFTSSSAAILTSHALGQTYSQIEKAFVNFARHRQNYNALEVNLATAVNRVPWNRRDGLLATVEAEPSAVRSDIASTVTKPVVTEMQNTVAELNDFVQSSAPRPARSGNTAPSSPVRVLTASSPSPATTIGSGTVTGPTGQANAVIVQPADGKIVAAGIAPNSSGYGSFALARYNPDGTPDAGFGSDGQVVTTMSTSGSSIYGAAIQPDGMIVAVGDAVIAKTSGHSSSLGDEFAVARYTTSGALDTTFGGTKGKNGKITNAGEVFLSFGSGIDQARAVAFETVGGSTEIVVAGWTNSVTGHPEVALARYNSHGSLDTTFAGTGTVVTSIPNSSIAPSAYAVAVQPDGKIVVAGGTNGPGPYPAFLARYNVNGSLDTTIGNHGLVVSQFTSQDAFSGVAIQTDGKIVAVGAGAVGGNFVGEVARYNSDGTLDTTFGGGTGVVLNGAAGTQLNAVALQANGQIVASGVAPNYETLVTRINADGSLDTTYGSGGSVITAIGQLSQDNAVAIQPLDGEAVTAGFTSTTNVLWPNSHFLVSRYTTSGQLDTTF